jgi:hypothetical protein
MLVSHAAAVLEHHLEKTLRTKIMRKIEGQSEIAMPNRFGDPVVKIRRNSVPSSPLERYLSCVL